MLISPEPISNYRHITSRNFYTIYYGWLISNPDGTPNQIARQIAAARPKLLIASFYTAAPSHANMSKQVRALMADAGVPLFAYVDTDYGRRDLEVVRAEVNDYLGQGIDGIFFDQVYNFLDESRLSYYRELSLLVRGYSKSLIFNTGVSQPGEVIMTITDILMVEHDWRNLYQSNPWFAHYPPERFMGNSSNEHPDYATLDVATAVKDTLEAWGNGVGWHYSTNLYVDLPNWYSEYVTRLDEES